MKIKSMTDAEISCFNEAISELCVSLEALRSEYQNVEEKIDELKAAIDTIEFDVDDDAKENFELIDSMHEICIGVEQLLISLEEAAGTIEWAEKGEEEDDNDE